MYAVQSFSTLILSDGNTHPLIVPCIHKFNRGFTNKQKERERERGGGGGRGEEGKRERTRRERGSYVVDVSVAMVPLHILCYTAADNWVSHI